MITSPSGKTICKRKNTRKPGLKKFPGFLNKLARVAFRLMPFSGVEKNDLSLVIGSILRSNGDSDKPKVRG